MTTRNLKTSPFHTPWNAIAISFAIATVSAFGCSSDPVSGVAGSGAGASSSSAESSSSSSSTSSGMGGAGGSAPSCKGPGYLDTPTPQLVDSVDAILVDFAGQPLAALPVQVCGMDLCLNATTNGAGHVAFAVNGKMMLKPALKYADGFDYARFATPLPNQSVVTFVNPLPVGQFPDLAMGKPMVAGQTVTSGDVTLSFATGTSIVVDELVYDTPDKQVFRSVTIPQDKFPAAVDPALNLELLFATVPIETIFCPAAAVSVPNSLNWPAGTAVEFFVHGLDIGQEYAPYGGWAKVSDGNVSADGKTVETSADGGLPVLSNFGIRRN